MDSFGILDLSKANISAGELRIVSDQLAPSHIHLHGFSLWKRLAVCWSILRHSVIDLKSLR